MPSVHRRPDSPHWICAYTLPDGRRAQHSSRTTDKSLAMAMCLELAHVSREARQGRFTETHARDLVSRLYNIANREELSVASAREHVEGWLVKKALEVSDRSMMEYRRIAADWLKHLGRKADQPIDMVTVRQISNYRTALAGRVGGATVNKSMAILSSCWADAVRDGLLRDNPFVRLRKVRTVPSRRRPFTLDELKRVLEACDEEWRGMVLVGFYTGQRLGDISNLTWENVDLAHQEIRMVTGKTKRAMTIPITRSLLRFLLTLSVPDDPRACLFPSAAPALSGTLSRQFTAILAGIGLARQGPHRSTDKGRDAKREPNELSFHSLRHTATSQLKNRGVTNVVAMELIGHESEAISRVYTHIDTDTLREAVERLPDIVPGAK